MIRRVRRQFICITMAMLTTVLLIPLIALNVITEAMSYNQTRNLLEQIAISETAVRQMPDGAPPDGKRPQETTDAVPAAGSDTSTETQLLPQTALPLLRKLPPSRRNVLLRKPRRQEAVLRFRRQCRHSHPRPGRQLLPRQRRQPQGQPPHGRPRLLSRLPRRLFHVKQSPRQHSRLSLIPLVRQSRICRRIRRRGGAGTIRLMTTRTTGKITPPVSRCSTPCRWQVWHSLCP